MAKYQLPMRYRSGFKTLVELDSNSLNGLTDRLKTFEIGGGPKKLIEHLHDLPVPNIDEVARTIFSFGSILIDKNINVSLVATELVEHLIHNSDNDLDSSKNEFYVTNLIKVLDSSNNIKVSYKALALSSEVSNVFRDSTIITDLRLISAEKLEDKNRHTLISQQLRIIYTTDDRDKTIYLTLDREDLEILREQIDRALAKELMIRNEYSEILNIIKIGE